MVFFAVTPEVIPAGSRIVDDCLDDSFLTVVAQVVGLASTLKYCQYAEDLWTLHSSAVLQGVVEVVLYSCDHRERHR